MWSFSTSFRAADSRRNTAQGLFDDEAGDGVIRINAGRTGLLDLEAPVENWIPELAGARALIQPNAPLEDCIELTHGP